MKLKNTLLLLNSIALFGAIVWIYFKPDFEPIIAAIGLTGTFLISLNDFLKKRKSHSIQENQILVHNHKISIIGFLGSGKTVYMIFLLNELCKNSYENFRFYMPDKNTREKTLLYILNLYDNRPMIPPTGENEGTNYQLDVFKGKRDVLKINFGDFSGTDHKKFIKSFIDGSPMWIHDIDYFNYILESSALVFAVDLDKYLQNNQWAKYTTYSFIEVINRLASKQDFVNELLKTPICILFLKCDLLHKYNKQEINVLNGFNDLISFCKKRCKYVNHYFVSCFEILQNAKAKSDKQNLPISNVKINLKNVTEPFFWLMEKII